jgi:hypothetical protein
MLSARIRQVEKLVRKVDREVDLPWTAYGATALGSGLYAANSGILEIKKKNRDFMSNAGYCTGSFIGGLLFGPPYFVLLAATWPIRKLQDYQRK